MVQANMGWVAYLKGDHGTARRLQEASLATMRAHGDKWAAAYSLQKLGLLALDQQEIAAARSIFTEALVLFQEVEGKSGIAECIEGLAVAAAAQREPERAARLLGATQTLREAIGHEPLPPPGHPHYERLPAAAQSRQLRQALATAWGEGRAMALEDVIAYAIQEPSPP